MFELEVLIEKMNISANSNTKQLRACLVDRNEPWNGMVIPKFIPLLCLARLNRVEWSFILDTSHRFQNFVELEEYFSLYSRLSLLFFSLINFKFLLSWKNFLLN